MKKSVSLISIAAIAALSFNANAALEGSGYYRITNNYTDRYIYVTDNTGSINLSSTTADMAAIDLWMGIERTLYDPATVLYLQNISGNQYDIQAQSTGIHQIINFYVTLAVDPRKPEAYVAYGSSHGLTKYLYDGRSNLTVDWSYLSDAGNAECKYWKINPIDVNSDNYFGVKPNVTAGGVNYASFFAEFPFSFSSPNMQACYISNVDSGRGYAVYKEITGTVPGATPLFIKCNSENYSENRLNIGGSATAITDNKATGVYFNNDKNKHVNRVAYNPQTMRVLGTGSDGSLALVTADYDYVPRNTFYVTVPAGSPAVYKIVSEDEYNEIVNSNPVDAESVTVSPDYFSIILGDTRQLTATVLPANTTNPTVTWSSSDTAVATVSSTGLVTTVGTGEATITATTVNGLTSSCSVVVLPVAAESVTVSPDYFSVYVGGTRQLTATVLPANTTNPGVTWSSSNTAVATVDANGLVTATGAGEAMVTATTNNGLTSSCRVVVLSVNAESVTVSPDYFSVFVGGTRQLTATVLPANTTDPTVTWSSSNTAVATVDANGLVTATGAGEATITATTTNGLTSSCRVVALPVAATGITLNTTSLTLTVDDHTTLVATVTPDNATNKTVHFESSDTNVATVDANGVVTAIAGGNATITARLDGTGFTATCAVTVNKKTQTITWQQEFGEVHAGDVIELLAVASSGLDVVYEVSANATVEGKMLTVLVPGEVVVTARQEGDHRHEAAEPVEMRFNALAGINDAVCDNISVKSGPAQITVTGKPADTELYVYSVNGTLVYAGTDHVISLQPHTPYILVIGRRAYKVVTK